VLKNKIFGTFPVITISRILTNTVRIMNNSHVQKTRMKKSLITIILLTSSLFCFSVDIKKDPSQVKITYIANEGFLIEVNDKSLLIDALFGAQEYDFCDIPDEAQLEGMRNARGHFKDIDLILATHAHRDHFHAPFVMDHLSKNKKGTFISCEQSIHQITGSDAYNPAIQSQLVEVTPDSLSFIDTVVNGIEMRVFRLNHGPYYEEDPETGEKINRHRNVQNLGFLFHLDGIKIFHGGDSSPAWKSDFEHFRLDKENIDIAFLGRAFIPQIQLPIF